MKVTYSEDKKHAYFDGETFTRDERTGYYLTTKNNDRAGRRLHRVVWEYYNGTIPKGYHVHHKDFNKGNNDISNLQLMSSDEHKKLHGSELTNEEIEWRRNNIKKTAQPKAAEWHKSEEGKKRHKEQYGKTKDRFLQKKIFVCEVCGKEFESQNMGRNRFCSNKCKSAWRRKSGLDNEIRVCEICGKEFEVNKYSKAKTCSRKCAAIMRNL